jgi:hypothetical protein
MVRMSYTGRLESVRWTADLTDAATAVGSAHVLTTSENAATGA